MAEFIGEPAGAARRVVIVAARFNSTVTEKLVEGAIEACVKHGVAFDDVDVLWVPGAWELPAGVMKALQTERYDACVAIGAVVRGDTPHFDFVAGEASRGLALLQWRLSRHRLLHARRLPGRPVLHCLGMRALRGLEPVRHGPGLLLRHLLRRHLLPGRRVRHHHAWCTNGPCAGSISPMIPLSTLQAKSAVR